MKNSFLLLSCFLFLNQAATAGATRSNLNAVWYDRTFVDVPLRKVFVVGLTDDPEKRKSFETNFTQVIQERGMSAEASSDAIPSAEGLSRDAVKGVIKGKGFDSVLVCRLIDVRNETTYVPGTQTQRSTPQSNPYSSSFDESYQGMYNTVITPGYLNESKAIVIEVDIYSAKTGRRIWSAESATLDPLSLRDLVVSMSKAMGRDLSEKGIIGPLKNRAN